MNRAQRRAKEKEARKRNSLGISVDWVAGSYKKPVEEPKEEQIPGVNCKPQDPEFKEKVSQNIWHDRSELDQFVETIKAQSIEDDYTWSWAYNHSCKYIDIRVDMRDGGFIVMDREGRRIDLPKLKWQYKSLEEHKKS